MKSNTTNEMLKFAYADFYSELENGHMLVETDEESKYADTFRYVLNPNEVNRSNLE